LTPQALHSPRKAPTGLASARCGGVSTVAPQQHPTCIMRRHLAAAAAATGAAATTDTGAAAAATTGAAATAATGAAVLPASAGAEEVTSCGSSTPSTSHFPIAATASSSRRRLLHAALSESDSALTVNLMLPSPTGMPVRTAAADRTPTPVDADTLFQEYFRQLRAEVDRTARMSGTLSVPCEVVHGAQVPITVAALDPIQTWTQYKDVNLLALCSCTGIPGLGRSTVRRLPMEFAEIEAALGRSSTWRHATALPRAYEELGHRVGAVSLPEFFLACPSFRGSRSNGDDGDAPVGTLTYLFMYSGKRNKVPSHAVYYNHAWETVVVRPTSNNFKLATCCHIPCETRRWGCIHAKAVNKVTRVDAS